MHLNNVSSWTFFSIFVFWSFLSYQIEVLVHVKCRQHCPVSFIPYCPRIPCDLSFLSGQHLKHSCFQSLMVSLRPSRILSFNEAIFIDNFREQGWNNSSTFLKLAWRSYLLILLSRSHYCLHYHISPPYFSRWFWFSSLEFFWELYR